MDCLNISNSTDSIVPPLEAGEFEYEKLYKTLRIIQLVLLIIIFIIGTIGNVSVIVLVWRKGRKRKVKHYFLCHLAFADSLVVMISLPLKIHDEYAPSATISPSLWTLWAKIIPTVIPFSVFLSAFTMVFMAWERHRVIAQPFKDPVTKCKIFKLLVLQWVVAILTVIPITYTSQYDGEILYSDWGSKLNLQIYTLCQTFIQFFFPLSIILVYHVKIISYVRHVRKNIAWFTRAKQSRQAMRRNLKLYKKCMVTVVVFAVCVFPEVLFALWTDFGNLAGYEHEGVIGAVGSLFVITQSAINPSIYANFDQILLKKVKKMF